MKGNKTRADAAVGATKKKRRRRNEFAIETRCPSSTISITVVTWAQRPISEEWKFDVCEIPFGDGGCLSPHPRHALRSSTGSVYEWLSGRLPSVVLRKADGATLEDVILTTQLVVPSHHKDYPYSPSPLVGSSRSILSTTQC